MTTDMIRARSAADRLNAAMSKVITPKPLMRLAKAIRMNNGTAIVTAYYSDGHEENFTPEQATRAAEHFEGGGKVFVSLKAHWDVTDGE